MCHGLFWVFDFLLVLICFLVFVLKCRASLHIASYLCTFPAIQVFAVWCAVCCLCFFNRLRLNFLLPGGCSLVWVFAWFLLVWDSPAQHPHISAKEKVAFIFCQQILPTSEPTIRSTLRKALRAEEKWNLAEFLGATFSHQFLFRNVFWVCLYFCLFVSAFLCLCFLVCLFVFVFA